MLSSIHCKCCVFFTAPKLEDFSSKIIHHITQCRKYWIQFYRKMIGILLFACIHNNTTLVMIYIFDTCEIYLYIAGLKSLEPSLYWCVFNHQWLSRWIKRVILKRKITYILPWIFANSLLKMNVKFLNSMIFIRK